MNFERGMKMQYQDRTVGEIDLPKNSPAWLIQLAAAVPSVDRNEFLSTIESLAAQVRSQSRSKAVELVRELVADSGLSLQDVFPSEARAPKTSRGPAPVRYRDPTTGKTWSGRGVAPRWLQGKNRDEFTVP